MYLEVPPFDVLTSQPAPYSGFGEPLNVTKELMARFEQTESQARKRITEVFHLNIGVQNDVPVQLETIIKTMWSEGWQPAVGNVNLFAGDFGSVLANAIRQTLCGDFVFRSSADLSHLSIWWPKRGIEAFPVHKIYKRLLSADGESISFFAERLAELVAEAPL